MRVHWLHFSRDWIARSGSKKQRRTVLVFVLQRAALVEFGVVQVSPECRPVGHFRVQGRLGLNRVRFQGRIGRTVLGPGTYRIQASAGGQRVVDTRLVIVRQPSGAQIAASRSANACRSAAEASTSSAAGMASAAAGSGGAGGRSTQTGARTEDRSPRDRGALGARFASEAIVVVKRIPAWLYVLLGVAIALLALAALPLRAAPNRELAFLLARRRGAIAVAGAGGLLMVTVTYLLY